jgi:Tol biopolymer transport system component
VPGNHYNGAPDVSDDGRFVAFYSQSTNLPAGQRAIYVIDRSSGDWYTVTQPLGTHLFGNEYLDLAGDGSSIAFAWAASVPSLPGFGRLNIYTVELQGQPPAREVGSVGSAAIVLLLALLAITASRRLAGRVRKTVSF